MNYMNCDDVDGCREGPGVESYLPAVCKMLDVLKCTHLNFFVPLSPIYLLVPFLINFLVSLNLISLHLCRLLTPKNRCLRGDMPREAVPRLVAL